MQYSLVYKYNICKYTDYFCCLRTVSLTLNFIFEFLKSLIIYKISSQSTFNNFNFESHNNKNFLIKVAHDHLNCLNEF